jgi:hypothetical protein
MAIENKYKVKLENAHDSGEKVTFNVSPELSENRAVNYTPLEPVQAPGQIFIYKNTSSRTFDLGDVKFVSRTQEEARKNLEDIQMIRSWTLPWFAQGGAEDLGAPPAILKFTAYSSKIGVTNLFKIPVVIGNLSINYPTDVDYIPALGTLEPAPTIISISISLMETHSPAEYSNTFSLTKYKKGILVGF